MPDDDEEAENFAVQAQIEQIVPALLEIADDAPNSNAMRRVHGRIDVWVHNMQTLSVHENDVAASGVIPILEDFLSDDDLPFRTAKRFPPATFDHMLAILRKWQNGDFGVHPHRGFRRVNGRYRRIPDWPHARNGCFFGHGHLVNGQRFVSRRQMSLEGAHAPTIAGISGTESRGAYSVVMGLHFPKQKLVYADVDCGDTIYYISTALPPEEGEITSNITDPADQNMYVDPTNATRGAKALLKSHETRTPVRVFRSWKASKKVGHRPAQGYRYDGLYEVIDYECLKQRRQIYRFRMKRVRGQNPIHGVKEAEPTARKRKADFRRETSEAERKGASTSTYGVSKRRRTR
jgi:uncharacterized protein (UPF0147 family)